MVWKQQSDCFGESDSNITPYSDFFFLVGLQKVKTGAARCEAWLRVISVVAAEKGSSRKYWLEGLKY